MFIPTWVFWILATVGVFILASRISERTGDYDFVSPFVGLGVILLYLAFIIGYVIAHFTK